MNTKESPEPKAGATSPYAEMWLRGWEPYVRMFGQFAQPSAAVADLGKLQQRYVEFASNEGAAAYRKFSELSANYYAALLNTGLNLSQEFYEQVYQARTTPSVPFQAPVAPARELVFTGALGNTVSRSFVISNKTDRPAHVSFELSEFINESGSAKVRVDAELRPGSFELAGMAEETVDCSLPLTRAFQPGSEYRAVLRVVGFENMTVGLVVRAESPAAPEKHPRSASGRRRKKRKA